MFTFTWKKYLPVIHILLKKVSRETQTLQMNETDFRRAAGGRKIKFSFASMQIKNGKIVSGSTLSPVAKELGALLQESDITRYMIRDLHVEFSLDNSFLLTIKDATPVVVSEEEVAATEEAATTEE
jgi:hypothetical protein